MQVATTSQLGKSKIRLDTGHCRRAKKKASLIKEDWQTSRAMSKWVPKGILIDQFSFAAWPKKDFLSRVGLGLEGGA